MRAQHIERLIVQHCHRLRIGRCSIGLCNAQTPLFFLPGNKPVSKGFPLYVQFVVRQKATYVCTMFIKFAVFHPCTGEQDAFSVFCLIGKLARRNGITLVETATFEHFIARNYRVYDVLILIRGAHLNINSSPQFEYFIRLIEPVIGINSGLLIGNCEDYEFLFQRIIAAYSLNNMSSRCERSDIYRRGLVRLYCAGIRSVDGIAYFCCNVFTRIVHIIKGDGFQTVTLYARREST